MGAPSDFATSLADRIKLYQGGFSQVIDLADYRGRIAQIDLSVNNAALCALDFDDPATLERFIWADLETRGAVVGVGGYGEDRAWYARSKNFVGTGEIRSIHLGIDFWIHAGTPVCAPLPAKVHSFQDNAHDGDYGPTIILEHQLDSLRFFTLYGHLSRESLIGKHEGMPIAAGECFAAVGNYPINGAWPPHLHIQIIDEMNDLKGDFPGVAYPSRKAEFLARCPDPNLILGLAELC